MNKERYSSVRSKMIDSILAILSHGSSPKTFDGISACSYPLARKLVRTVEGSKQISC